MDWSRTRARLPDVDRPLHTHAVIHHKLNALAVRNIKVEVVIFRYGFIATAVQRDYR